MKDIALVDNYFYNSPPSSISVLNLLRRQELIKSLSLKPPQMFLPQLAFIMGSGGQLRHLQTLKLIGCTDWGKISRSTGFALGGFLAEGAFPLLEEISITGHCNGGIVGALMKGLQGGASPRLHRLELDFDIQSESRRKKGILSVTASLEARRLLGTCRGLTMFKAQWPWSSILPEEGQINLCRKCCLH